MGFKENNAWIIEDNDEESLDDFRLDLEKIAVYKFVPIISVDVVRSFSTYKPILDDPRHANYCKFQQIFGLIEFLSFFNNKFSFFFLFARNAVFTGCKSVLWIANKQSIEAKGMGSIKLL